MNIKDRIEYLLYKYETAKQTYIDEYNVPLQYNMQLHNA